MSIKILVIDDEPDLQLLIRKKFKERINSDEFDFLFASDGAEGLQKLNDDNGIEVIFTDLRMPVMDGLAFLEKLKSKNLISKAIVISAYDDFENIRIAMNRGAFDFITKPIDFDDLEITLQKAIEEYNIIKEGITAKENLKQTMIEKEQALIEKTIAQEKMLEALIEKEQFILKQNEMLERMVEERTSQLQEAQLQLIKIEKEKEAEKVRIQISRDLHDDLGATLSSISVYSAAAKQKLNSESIAEVGNMLERISSDAQEMVASVSERVWLMKTENSTIEKLIERLQLFASRDLTAKNISFAYTCDDDVKNVVLNTIARKNIFLIFKEAIHNAAKNSEATMVTLNVIHSSNNLEISLTDNGIGFDQMARNNSSITGGGNGLINMKHRAGEIDAQFNIATTVGKGTSIKLVCSLPKIGEQIANI